MHCMRPFGIDMRIRNWVGTRLADILSPNSWRLWESYSLLRRSGWSGQVRIYIIYGHGIDLVIKEYSEINSGRIKTFKAEYYQSRVIFLRKTIIILLLLHMATIFSFNTSILALSANRWVAYRGLSGEFAVDECCFRVLRLWGCPCGGGSITQGISCCLPVSWSVSILSFRIILAINFKQGECNLMLVGKRYRNPWLVLTGRGPQQILQKCLRIDWGCQILP